jgi:hypothetical protein
MTSPTAKEKEDKRGKAVRLRADSLRIERLKAQGKQYVYPSTKVVITPTPGPEKQPEKKQSEFSRRLEESLKRQNVIPKATPKTADTPLRLPEIFDQAASDKKRLDPTARGIAFDQSAGSSSFVASTPGSSPESDAPFTSTPPTFLSDEGRSELALMATKMTKLDKSVTATAHNQAQDMRDVALSVSSLNKKFDTMSQTVDNVAQTVGTISQKIETVSQTVTKNHIYLGTRMATTEAKVAALAEPATPLTTAPVQPQSSTKTETRQRNMTPESVPVQPQSPSKTGTVPRQLIAESVSRQLIAESVSVQSEGASPPAPQVQQTRRPSLPATDINRMNQEYQEYIATVGAPKATAGLYSYLLGVSKEWEVESLLSSVAAEMERHRQEAQVQPTETATQPDLPSQTSHAGQEEGISTSETGTATAQQIGTSKQATMAVANFAPQNEPLAKQIGDEKRAAEKIFAEEKKRLAEQWDAEQKELAAQREENRKLLDAEHKRVAAVEAKYQRRWDDEQKKIAEAQEQIATKKRALDQQETEVEQRRLAAERQVAAAQKRLVEQQKAEQAAILQRQRDMAPPPVPRGSDTPRTAPQPARLSGASRASVMSNMAPPPFSRGSDTPKTAPQRAPFPASFTRASVARASVVSDMGIDPAPKSVYTMKSAELDSAMDAILKNARRHSSQISVGSLAMASPNFAPIEAPSLPQTHGFNPQQPQKGTDVCRFFKTPHGCKRGNACDHLHIPAEGPPVDPRSMELCRFVVKGGCRKSICNYAHSVEEVAMAGGDQTMAEAPRTGSRTAKPCRWGADCRTMNCRFMHPSDGDAMSEVMYTAPENPPADGLPARLSAQGPKQDYRAVIVCKNLKEPGGCKRKDCAYKHDIDEFDTVDRRSQTLCKRVNTSEGCTYINCAYMHPTVVDEDAMTDGGPYGAADAGSEYSQALIDALNEPLKQGFDNQACPDATAKGLRYYALYRLMNLLEGLVESRPGGDVEEQIWSELIRRCNLALRAMQAATPADVMLAGLSADHLMNWSKKFGIWYRALGRSETDPMGKNAHTTSFKLEQMAKVAEIKSKPQRNDPNQGQRPATGLYRPPTGPREGNSFQPPSGSRNGNGFQPPPGARRGNANLGTRSGGKKNNKRSGNSGNVSSIVMPRAGPPQVSQIHFALDKEQSLSRNSLLTRH